ncbi:MAG: AAA-like domain-containing protein [Cyanobacteria bacterium P01_F01_bin.150]
MPLKTSPLYEYRVGGSLSSTDPTYIKRSADIDLYQSLSSGEFCYVLTSRQMGKSSLRMQMRSRLTESNQGQCISLDISRIGSAEITPNQWYQGIAFEILRGCQLSRRKIVLKQWWDDQGDITPVQKLGHFLEELLMNIFADTRLFIFLDEIDSIRNLKFCADDFFALIRFCYNKRADNSDYQRLTWALFGVATPSDLIADPKRTPFNIGRAIALSGFTFEEAQPLAKGLEGLVSDPQSILQKILGWTNGQPFLTQKLCALVQAIAQTPESSKVTDISNIDALVCAHIIDHWKLKDEPEHLKTIRDRILADDHRATRLLGLYQRIHTYGSIAVTVCPEQDELLLSGIVRAYDGQIMVANPIYKKVFSLNWVSHQLSQRRPYATVFQAWIDSNQADEAALLCGQALEKALEWSQGKSISDLDYQFLAASQELDNRMIRRELEASEKAKLMLADAKKKAQRIMLLGYLSLGICLILSVVAIVVSYFMTR